jgi:hypothetical protein
MRVLCADMEVGRRIAEPGHPYDLQLLQAIATDTNIFAAWLRGLRSNPRTVVPAASDCTVIACAALKSLLSEATRPLPRQQPGEPKSAPADAPVFEYSGNLAGVLPNFSTGPNAERLCAAGAWVEHQLDAQATLTWAIALRGHLIIAVNQNAPMCAAAGAQRVVPPNAASPT